MFPVIQDGTNTNTTSCGCLTGYENDQTTGDCIDINECERAHTSASTIYAITSVGFKLGLDFHCLFLVTIHLSITM